MPEAPPVKILPSVGIFEVIGIDGVTHSSVGHRDDHAEIFEWSCRRTGDSHPGSALVMISPNAHGVIKDVFPVDIIDIRGPKRSIRFPRRAASGRESLTDQSPIHQILTSVDGYLADRVVESYSCGIGVIISVPAPIVQNRRIRTVVRHHWVVVIRNPMITTTYN